MISNKPHCLLAIACALTCSPALADWRYENVFGSEQASVFSDNRVDATGSVGDTVASLGAELRIVSGKHGTRIWLSIDAEGQPAAISCEDSYCELSVAFDEEPPIRARSCYADGPYSVYQGVKFDASKRVLEGLRKSKNITIAVPVTDGDGVSRASFTFSIANLKYSGSNRRDVCEGDFAGNHGAVER